MFKGDAQEERSEMTTYTTEKVGTTKDYSIFQYFDRNRVIGNKHVEFLRDDMNKRGQLERVIVNDKWFVIDGQHRIAARQKDKKPVDFRVMKGASIKHVVALNNTGKRWNNTGWARNFSHKEWPNCKPYLQYLEFKKTNGFAESICMALLSEDFHDYGRKAFKNGSFKVKNIERANQNAAELAELISIDKRFNRLKSCLAFIKFKTLKDFKLPVFKDQLEKWKKKITPCNNVEDWIDAFLLVYNFNLRAPKKKLTNRYIN